MNDSKIMIKDYVLGLLILAGHFGFSWFYLPNLNEDFIAYQLLYSIVLLFFFSIWVHGGYKIKTLIFYIFNTIIMVISYKFFPVVFLKSYNLLVILPNLIFSVSVFVYCLQYFDKSRDDGDEGKLHLPPILLTVISFLLLVFSALIGNQEVSDVFNLPASDLPITASFSIIIFFIFSILIIDFICYILAVFVLLFLLLKDLFNKNSNWKLLMVRLFMMCFIGINFMIIDDYSKKDGKVFTIENADNLLKNIAYEADFQYLERYFSAVEIQDEKMKKLLTDKDTTTAKVKLHENGHISLMCMPNNILSEEIHVFKYDDLEKSGKDWSEITNDCLRNGYPT